MILMNIKKQHIPRTIKIKTFQWVKMMFNNLSDKYYLFILIFLLISFKDSTFKGNYLFSHIVGFLIVCMCFRFT